MYINVKNILINFNVLFVVLIIIRIPLRALSMTGICMSLKNK